MKPDAGRIRRMLDGRAAGHVDRIDAFDQIDSTNSWLKQQPSPPARNMDIAIADHQVAGRGRHERAWLSAPGDSLCLSLAYTFEKAPDLLPPLTLAIGVAVAQALAGLGVENVRLKWPNDLLIDDGKLGGILVESVVNRRDAVTVVAGIGINIDVSEDVAASVQSAWAHRPIALTSVAADLPDREALAAKVITGLFDAIVQYDDHGFRPFQQAFADIDWLKGRAIVVESPDGDITGVAAGIEHDGSLLLQRTDRVQRIFSGSIRIDQQAEAKKQAV